MPKTSPLVPPPEIQAALKIMFEATISAEEKAQSEHRPREVFRYSRARAVIGKWFLDHNMIEEGCPVEVTPEDEALLNIHPDKPPKQPRAI